MIKNALKIAALILLVNLLACAKPEPEIIYRTPPLPESEKEPFYFTLLDPVIIRQNESRYFCISTDQSLVLLREIKTAEKMIKRLQGAYTSNVGENR